MSLGCQLKSKAFCISGLYQSLDPPKSPLRRGTLNALSPCRGGAKSARPGLGKSRGL